MVIVGVGNRLRGDDAVGPALVDALAANPHIHCIDAGTTPENYVRTVVRLRPEVVLIVDAAHLGKAPGQYELLRKQDIAESGLTTHTISPALLIGFLEQCTPAPIYMIAVQPETVSFGQGMSESVSKAVADLACAITRSLAA